MLKSLLKDIHNRGSSIRSPDKGPAGNSDAHERWLDELLVRMFQLMHKFEQDNFDANRYRNEPANAFFADRHAAYFAFLLKNVEIFFRSRQLLEDETSRALYDQLILFRVLGPSARATSVQHRGESRTRRERRKLARGRYRRRRRDRPVCTDRHRGDAHDYHR